MSAPSLAVVVIGRNEGERLRRCLESVRTALAAYPSSDIVYVDSGSGDASLAIAAAAGARTVSLGQGRHSAARARNAGWQACASALVLFLDGDTVLAPEFLPAALAALDDAAVGVVWGHRRELNPRQSVYVRVLDLDWIYPPGDSLFCGGDALMRRALLATVGGFDEALIAGEEPELCSRLRAAGARIAHLDVAMTGHDLAILSFRAYWRRAFRAGHAYAEVARRCRLRREPLWRREARANVGRGSAVVCAPLATLAACLWHPGAGAALLTAAALLLLRSVRRSHWKTTERGTRLLYALHSHFQQLPILCGQLAYHRDRLRGRRRGLIEYHGKPS